MKTHLIQISFSFFLSLFFFFGELSEDLLHVEMEEVSKIYVFRARQINRLADIVAVSASVQFFPLCTDIKTVF